MTEQERYNNTIMYSTSSEKQLDRPTIAALDQETSLSGEASVPYTAIWTPFHQWLTHSAWPGMGLFGESYILFSIGTLTPLWEVLFPDCFDYTICKPRLLYSLTFSVVAGVILGMLVIGRCANTIGRRKGSLLTASLMAGGAWSMVVESYLWTSQESAVLLFRSMSLSLFFFGVGVGGEYPLSCSLAAEKTASTSTTDNKNDDDDNNNNNGSSSTLNNDQSMTGNDKETPLTEKQSSSTTTNYQASRGRQIQLVFAMQGVGIWFNSLTLLFLLWILGQSSLESYQTDVLLTIWRVTYMFGATVLLIVLVTRYVYLEESKVWEKDRAEAEEDREKDAPDHPLHPTIDTTTTHQGMESSQMVTPDIVPSSSTVSELSNPTVMLPNPGDEDNTHQDLQQSYSLYVNMEQPESSTSLWYNYGGRLFGASLAWLLWDISFYGNKLFQATFLLALTGDETTLLEFAFSAAVNSTVALLGYFGAAFLLDVPYLGRVRLQCLGFIVTGLLFVTCGFSYDSLPSGWLVGLYLGCSFAGQLGPNATTFLIPGEIFPTEQRTYCHGICAASGKVGALIAAVLFHFVQQEANLFLLCGYASFAGCVVTYYFIPETSGLDLNEVDKKWQLTRDGRGRDYRGPANLMKYQSLFERQKANLW
ncbi:major facilitator superfamily permease [Nitzschia inconspicua]|uniref:Major facilitator superfamily permease n=1 Tax=Nitzschia inconspicua TaxID=303405 RepID=A0A9K3Q207_9STRA|nr:major facilitator superfamily permease [Nitzschia inconspicua]